jgi:hypothetical protein
MEDWELQIGISITIQYVYSTYIGLFVGKTIIS